MPNWIRRVWRLRKKARPSAGTAPDVNRPGVGADTGKSFASELPKRMDDDVTAPASSQAGPPTAVVGKSVRTAPAARKVCYLEALPAELRTLILLGLTDVESLRALVHASPIFYQQYLLDRRALLAHALRAELGNRVFVDAYAAQASATRYPPGSNRSRASVTWFLDKYSELRTRSTDDDPAVAAAAGNPSEADLIRMVVFHRTVVRPLVSEFAAAFLLNLDESLEVGNLSVMEQRRFLRALYRFQLYCHLFGPGPRGTTGWKKFGSPDEVQVTFFYDFKPWEIEEIHSVYTLIQEKYTDILDAIKDDVDPTDPKFAEWGPPIADPALYDLSSTGK